MDKLEQLSIAFNKSFEKILLTNKNFNEEMVAILGELGINKIMFEQKTGLEYLAYDRIITLPENREESRKYSLRTVTSICVGLKLDIRTADRLLRSLGESFRPTNRVEQFYDFFVQNNYQLDIAECNEILRLNNIGKEHYLGTVSKK